MTEHLQNSEQKRGDDNIMQKKSNSLRDMIVVGFALFSMFFGAGNVVFPPYLGMEAGPQWLAGFSAYFIADIGLALLGMFALLRVGSSEAVISRVGKVPAELLMCAIILCIGPMVAIPRTSATTFEMAIAPNLSGVSPVLFSVLFFALILVLCIKESAVVDIVGKILTPLLLGLFAIIIKGIITPVGEISALPQISNVAVTGIKAGYQTMDALAALPFGIIVLQSVTAKGYDNSKKQFRVVGGSAILAGVLLLAVYMGLAYLGATVSGQYNGTIGRAQLVMAIVEALMGKVGMILFGVVVGLACVTTAIALTSSAAAYFAELCRGKVPYKAFVIAICVFSAVVSNLGLDRIVAVAAPVLDVIYPPTLVLIFISLLMPRMPDRVSRGACIGALITSVLCTLTAHGVNIPVVPSLPLYDLGLSWLIPAAVFGLAASLLPFRARSREKRIVPLPNEEH
jgi:LIVCS family branched-chain amino acid:cation transporter